MGIHCLTSLDCFAMVFTTFITQKAFPLHGPFPNSRNALLATKHGNGISPYKWTFLAGKIIEVNGVFFQLATFDYWRVGLQISGDFRIPAPKRGFLCPLSTARFGPLGTLHGLRGALWLQGHMLQETLFLLIL